MEEGTDAHVCPAVKMPFLRYQLAMTVMQQSAASTFRPYPHTEHLLTADGLGVPDRIFSNLEVRCQSRAGAARRQ
jgi:hypothetical protein